jgi:DNA polymerase alpha subunit A
MLPPTERLCDPIEGTSRSILAEHFGLDAQKYATASYSGMSLDEDLIGYTPSTQMPDVQRYKDCKPFIVTCPGCKQSTSFSGIFNFVEDEATGLPEAKSGMTCAACGEHTFSLPHMTNMLGKYTNALFCRMSSSFLLLLLLPRAHCVTKCWFT